MGSEKYTEVRLQKYLADCGVASRRKAEEMILSGAVRVNGKRAALGDKVVPARDKVTVRGRRIVPSSKPVYLMLHKPRGYITTMQDEMDRRCVAELVQNVGVRVYPVGRLDRESEGLLLMTNDGAFAQMLSHPSRHVPKTYRVTVRPGITEDQLTAFATGVMVDGRKPRRQKCAFSPGKKAGSYWKLCCMRGVTGKFVKCASNLVLRLQG